MRGFAAGVAVLAAVACGGAVGGAESDGGGGDAGTAGSTSGTGGGGTGGLGFPPPDAGGGPTRPDGAGGTFVDPGCPDAEPNPVERECDPFSTFDDCGFGFACYPFVQYPQGNCGSEQFGTVCAPEGFGTQGDPCEQGDCAAGHVCVISGEGIQCVEMCPIEGADQCPPGLICEFLDVAGVGGCI